MTTRAIGPIEARPGAHTETLGHVGWLGAGAAIAFAIPWLGTSVLDLPHDVYYGAYFLAVTAFLVAYVQSTHVPWRQLLARNWRWSLIVGMVVATVVVVNVLGDPATDRPAGGYLAFEVLWRGVAYGVVDSLLLQAFPGAVAYMLLGGRLAGARRAAFAGLTLAMVLVVTGIYHLGYDQFRAEGIRQPETGNAILSVPVLLTANPAGSVVAHAAMHVTAVTHAYETPTYLPPRTSAD